MARCSYAPCQRWRPDAVVAWLGLGLRLDEAWFCCARCVRREVTDRLSQVPTAPLSIGPEPPPLGKLLLQQRGITSSQLREALARQHASGLRLGDQLTELGYTSRDVVLRALSAQSGVPYLAAIDRATVRTAPGGLGADAVRALGVVPFRESGQTLSVACRAPLPRASLAALRLLTGRQVEPYLVEDEELALLLEEYVRATPVSAPATTVRDAAAGASQVAAAAVQSGQGSVKETHIDPYTWVRIAADGRVSTLLVPSVPPTAEEQDTWLAATTRH